MLLTGVYFNKFLFVLMFIFYIFYYKNKCYYYIKLINLIIFYFKYIYNSNIINNGLIKNISIVIRRKIRLYRSI